MSACILAVAAAVLPAVGPASAAAQGRGTRGAGAPSDSAIQAQHAALRPARHLAGGRIVGIVTAQDPHGVAIHAPNVLVELWTTDAATSAARDAACAAWVADKMSWTQAKGELESPSGMDLTGTPVGRDVDVLKSLMALRRDTTRTDANGEFTFENVPFGAYTVEAEAYANDKFMQWSADAAVIPNVTARVTLDGKVLSENQYCAATAAPDTTASGSPTADASRIYNEKDLDHPLHAASPSFADNRFAAVGALVPEHSNDATIEYVVNQDGRPDPVSIKVTQGSVSASDAERAVATQQFDPPTVHGVPVKVHAVMHLGFAVVGIRR
jgi:hypothetical protein